MTAEEAHVVQHGIFACHPFKANSARIDAVGVETNASDDVCAALGSFEQRFGTSDALEGGGSVLKKDARHAGVEADENRVGTENDGVGDAILTGGKVDGLVRGDGFSNGFGVVGGAVAAGAGSTEVGPAVHWRQGGKA